MSRSAAIYVRISRDRAGAGLGIERQEQDCRELAEQLGWCVVAVLSDNDLSAYSGKPRPGYQALLAGIRSGRVDAVITWHTDRLHRRPVELESYIEICEARGVPTHCVKAGALDLASPSGRLVARQLGSVARYEVEHAIERQQRAKLQAAEAGKYRGGRRAFGYGVDGMTVEPLEAELIREMARRVLGGESLRSIAHEFNGRGSRGTFGARWTGASVRDVLIKPRTGGLIEYHGEVLGKALWPAVLPEETWRAVRAVLTAPGRSRAKTAPRRWLLSGLALCGRCGLPVKITSQRTSDGRDQRPNYRCSGRAVHVSRAAHHVNDLVTAVILARLGRADAAALLRPRTPLLDITALHTEAIGIRAQQDEMATMFGQGIATASQLANANTEFSARLTKLEVQIAEAAVANPLNGLVGAADVESAWGALSLDARRAVVDTLVVVTILPGRRGRKVGGHYFDPDSVRIEWKTAGA